ncbi:MAG: hypothetical protein GYA51_17980 [Candidatus Methanofastidiosa archaeon]|jgi:hypothetical protein|nr:hypothetical protein [Candidatus Methanofastidiosa archaeon]
MKIRSDFVTNSSSVSFILTMKEEIIDINIGQFRDSTIGEFFDFVKNKMIDEGQKTELFGEEIYTLKLDFNTDEAIPPEEFQISNLSSLRDLDIKKLTDEQLKAFLFWAILNPDFLFDIGLTRVETY